MFNIYVLLPVMTLCVIGVYFTIKEIAALLFTNSIESCVVMEVSGNADEIENNVRCALDSNPASDIVLIDKSGDEEIKAILSRLADDYERVHLQVR